MEKVAQVEGRDYSIAVRYTRDSGIPADAVLRAWETTDSASISAYCDQACSALEDTEEEDVEEFYLLNLSLIADQINYAVGYSYEVEIIMNQSVPAEEQSVQVMQFTGSEATALPTEAETDGRENIQSINFQTKVCN